jgi:ABC-2 type transport system permease protein
MRKWWSLTRVLIKNARNPFAAGRHKNAKTLLFAGLMALAFFPLIIQIGVFCYKLIGALSLAHLQGLSLSIGFSVVGAAVFIFGMLNVLSVFYFAEDVDVLLSMPLRPSAILSSKFAAALVYDYFIVLLFLLPLLAAYGLRMQPGAAYVPMAGLMFLLVPIIPLAMASILVMAAMRFMNFSRDRDRFGKIAGTVLLILMLALNYFLQKNTGVSDNPERLSQMLTSGRYPMLKGIAGYFPGLEFAVKAVLHCGELQGWVWAFFFFCAAVSAVVVFLAVGERLYFRGVQESTGRRVRTASGLRSTIVPLKGTRSPFAAIWMKDMTVLFRDSTYFMNCIVMNFLWPLFFLLILGKGSSGGLASFFMMMRDTRFTNPVLAAALGIGMVVTAMNAIASTAFSREGKHLFIMKTVPVPFGIQALAKAGVAAAMGCIACLLLFVVVVFMYGMPAALVTRTAVLLFLGILFSAMTGVLIDLFFPKLHWDNAYKAVKQNLNVPIHIALTFLCGAGVFWTVNRFFPESYHGFTILTAFAVGLNLAVFLTVIGIGSRTFGRIDA